MKKLSITMLCVYFMFGLAYAQTVYEQSATQQAREQSQYGSVPARIPEKPPLVDKPTVKAGVVTRSTLETDTSGPEGITNPDPKHADVPQPLDRDTDRKSMND